MLTANKRLLGILLAVPGLLLIPLIAMQFSSDVQWTGRDFLIMGIMLLSLGVGIEFILRKASTRRSRIVLAAGAVFLFLLVWAELAVGVFGSAWAGS